MKDNAPPPIVQNQFETVRALFERYVVPTYGRFDLAFSRGQGSHLWDVNGRRYLDLGGGIAVTSLGHAHPEITRALTEQAQKLVHVSNLYYQEPQGRLAKRITEQIGAGKVFFCNSGAEANEGLFKLARRFGHEEGRFEILTAHNSFHGRTLAGIAATGQEKVKTGFGPPVQGFRHVPFNDLNAVEAALSPATVAVLIEGIQGEGGIHAASPDYLLGLRRLCDKHQLLLLIDGVQCGHFRTGRFHSFQRILETRPDREMFVADAVAMAKSFGGGLPIGAFWIRQPHADLLGPGSHGTTFGGTPLAAAVALRIFEVIAEEKLDENARTQGEYLKAELGRLAGQYPHLIKDVRGLGLMIGIEFQGPDDIPALAKDPKTVSLQLVQRLHAAGLLTIPSGAQVVRLLPALNLKRAEADEGLAIIKKTLTNLG